MLHSSVLEICSEERKFILVLKCVAIFCVVCAHLYPVPSQTGEMNRLVSDILNYIGTMGVPVFFIISGFLFAGSKKNCCDFWKKRIKTLFLPWIFCYTVLYFYVILRKPGTISYIAMLLGYRSSAYYLSVLIMMYMLFWKNNHITVYALMVLSLLSIISTGWGWGLAYLNDIFGTYFLNPLNWAFFFGMGILLRKSKKQLVELADIGYCLPLLCFLSCAYFFVSHMINESVFYFSRFAILGHIINVPMLFGIAKMLAYSTNTIFVEIGTYSFPIYLTHQLFAGAIIMITNLCGNPICTGIRPFFVIGIVLFGIKMLKNTAPVIGVCIGAERDK